MTSSNTPQILLFTSFSIRDNILGYGHFVTQIIQDEKMNECLYLLHKKHFNTTIDKGYHSFSVGNLTTKLTSKMTEIFTSYKSFTILTK